MLPPKHCNINLTGPIPRWDEAIPLGNGILGSLLGADGAPAHFRGHCRTVAAPPPGGKTR